jgi:uncharacterized membrane protein
MMQDQATRSGEPVRQSMPRLNDFPTYDTFYRSFDAGRIAKALGWFSIGIGLAQLLAPRRVSRAIGVEQRPGLMRTLGVRELASGVGILSQRRQDNWLWTRVAGDAIDLALLGIAARTPGTARRRVALATGAVAGVAVLDLLAGIEQSRRRREAQGMADDTVHVEKSLVINRSPQECYRFWHDFENFPRFMRHLESVRLIGDNRMRWKAKGPAGTHVEWDAQLDADEPGKYLAWRSLDGSEIDNAGTVRFEAAPGERGTIVRVVMAYRPPLGKAGVMVAKVFGEEPSQQIDEDLRRFKWLIETGEVPTTIGQPSGTRGMVGRLLRRGAPG